MGKISKAVRGVADIYNESVLLTDDWAAYDLYIKIQILDHLADDGKLLSILLSEICSVRGYNMEQLGYNCAHTFEMDRTCFSTKCLR